MKFLYENFLQFYLLALTSITQQFKTNNLENSKIEETIKKMIKEQPVFKETINTGGNKQIIINNKPNDKENFLINYKKKNYL
ncbi:hypothetical protein [Spiroplasma endosymbiont of Thecophora atra]|uniref:hypothetical protein n=1 Tax=Spiroplasma endosymbiont of Thecophora atra TaxID=3066294 RepID=UPI0030D30B24